MARQCIQCGREVYSWSGNFVVNGICNSCRQRHARIAKQVSKEKKQLYTATFVKQLISWRGNQTVLYKLSAPLQDYDYVVVNSLGTHQGDETSIFGSNAEGEVADDLPCLYETEELSHTMALLAAGYKLILPIERSEGAMPIWIDKWPVTGTSVSKKTGRPNTYTVSRSAHDEWGCDCMAWINKPAPKVECQHILKKQMQLLKAGIAVIPSKKEAVATQDRAVRLED